MIIEIALGIVLAVIILALLPQILGIGIFLIVLALIVGFFVLLATEPSLQVWLVFMLVLLATFVAKEKTSNYWKPPLKKVESRIQLRLSAVAVSAILLVSGIGCLIGSFVHYPDYIYSTVILAIYGLASFGCAYWIIKKSRNTFTGNSVCDQ